MILPTMTYLEISKALFADKPKLRLRARTIQPKITKQIIKENKFPAYKWEEYTHQESHNHYLICFYAPTADSVNNLIVNYLAFLEEDHQRLVIQWGCWPYRKRGSTDAIATPAVSYYCQHFFDRYHERVWKKADMPYNEILCRYFSRNPLPIPLKMDERINRNYKKYGKFANYAFQVEDGICFIKSAVEGHEDTIGQKDCDFVSVVWYYTFVNEAILSETQIEAIQEEGAKYVWNNYNNLLDDTFMSAFTVYLNSTK